MMMSQEEFLRVSIFLKNKYGIDMTKKKEIVSGRLDNFIRNHDFENYHDFMNSLEVDDTGELEKELVNLLTTNHTYFMREPEHFEFLRKEVLPYLKKKEQGRKDLCIWCAASSTGEEPYTVAMVLMDFLGLEHEKWDTKVLATDISTNVLQQAVSGVYGAEQISSLPGAWKRRFFRQVSGEDSYMATQELKDQVIFRKFNLMDRFPFKRKMHVVFLRNVMIYFDEKTKNELIRKVYDVMEPGGYLFIGQTETINREYAPFQMIRPSIFRKEEGIR